MKKKTILLTCAGGSGPIYLAKKLSKRFNIILVDADEDNVGSQLGFQFYKVPFGNDPRYARVLTRIIKRHHVDIVVPGADEELVAIAGLTKKNCAVVGLFPRKSFLDLCLNKKKLMIALDQDGISHLCPFPTKSAVRYPAIAKPITGRGSRAVHFIKNEKQLNGYLNLYGKLFSEVLVQPHAAGTEYTVSVIVNNCNQIIGIVPKRIIVKRGITRSAVTERNRYIESVCRKIVDRYRPSGPFNVQLKIHQGKVRIFEINPRLSTTTVLTDRAFGNEVELFCKYLNKSILPKLPALKEHVFLYRYEENVFS